MQGWVLHRQTRTIHSASRTTTKCMTKKEVSLGDNIKLLRHKAGWSQQVLADRLDVARSTIADYERGKTEPSIHTLVELSKVFGIRIDDLICKDLKQATYEIIRNKNMKVLAITVDKDKKENIELVDRKAEAGYLQNAHDPEYIRELPRIWFPSIPQGTFRGFEIRGDSMLPMESGTVVICSYIEHLSEVKDDLTYVVITQQEGLVYKRVKVNRERQTLILSSDNTLYAPYEVDFEEVRELWQYYAHLSFSDAKLVFDQMLEERLSDIHQKVTAIYQKVK